MMIVLMVMMKEGDLVYKETDADDINFADFDNILDTEVQMLKRREISFSEALKRKADTCKYIGEISILVI